MFNYHYIKKRLIHYQDNNFNQLSLKYNGALALDVNNNLRINTVEPTPNGIASASTSNVVVGRLSQPMTCNSSLNVSGFTILANNVSCLYH